jgi:N-dimethylarginine dimethylaminohydrolase
VEGGDLVWLDSKRVLIAHGYRTNAEGIRQFQDLVGSEVEVREVPLPHFRGPNDVLHLMSMISPVDHDLALVYSPLMPVPFRNWLLELGMTLVEVPESEYDSLGCNVLALAPRRCVLVEGNPETRRALERAGAEVIEIEGSEICLKGSGGPTCLTRPLVRSPF